MVQKCKEENCNKHPSYNFSTETSRLYCNEHKKNGMVNIKKPKECKEENCNKQPCFNLPD